MLRMYRPSCAFQTKLTVVDPTNVFTLRAALAVTRRGSWLAQVNPTSRAPCACVKAALTLARSATTLYGAEREGSRLKPTCPRSLIELHRPEWSNVGREFPPPPLATRM